jgi:uncharacterized protein (TIGR02302 family)
MQFKFASRLDRLIALSRAALAWEFFWRAATGALGVVLLFLAVSWLGLWIVLPPTGRMVGVALFVALFVFVVVRQARAARLSRQAALARIDRQPGATHGIASSLADQPANSANDPATAALWRVHIARIERMLARTEIAFPSPRAIEWDKYALRAGALLLAVVGGISAGPERASRISAAFSWGGDLVAAPGARLDAWIDPPAYTGKPPIVLTGRAGDTNTGEVRRISAPVGSSVIIRAPSLADIDFKTDGALVPQAQQGGDAKARTAEKRFALKGDGHLQIGRENFEIAAVPDNPPTVELLEQPRANLRGSLTLSYKLDDDYGVIAAEGRVANPEIEGRPTRGRTLTPPPSLPLVLPPTANGLGESRATVDVSESPWAGARVSLTLHARDEGGNEASTSPVAIYLPQRSFTKPLARALVEQRRNLVLEPDSRARVASTLQALMIEPEKFDTSAGVFLGLSAAGARLAHARSDDDLRDVADFLWSMALQIEDGGLSDAEREMRAAEKQLRDALQRNASDEEIRKLTEQLKAAMDKFLAEMMQRQPENRDQAQQTPDPNGRSVTPEQLRKMLDQMQEMARSGNMADAQRMLDQLQEMLENLRTARRSNRQNEATRQMQKSLGDMDRLMRDQQQLRDDTYRDGRQSEEQKNQHGERGRQGAEKEKNLRERQSQLRDRLGEIEKQLGARGGESKKDLKDAEDAMREADGELGEGGDRDKAVDAQGRALDALKKGSDQLAQQMQQNGQSADQMGEGQPNGEPDGQNPGEADPLGRSTNRDPRFNPRAKYDPLGVSPALRAQRVLEELRRRLGDVSRPQDELDYLERLLRRY